MHTEKEHCYSYNLIFYSDYTQLNCAKVGKEIYDLRCRLIKTFYCYFIYLSAIFSLNDHTK